ncbi:hypothetical protein [Pseudoalteromonas sp. SR43-2]|uniref:hypothetical protein n=1 Tax=Pseudoalteromonas sp. SR43-2 TaxID=2760944 RepID=UPI0015FB7D0A|nr:hypothetical protein [Pseudoalteromonas sp. SR43-2]MBB1380070.1 hypothetical protein [Pseudoalteromonas sp. SR43-2]
MFFAIGWLLILLIHLNTLRRGSLASTKNTLIDEIYTLLGLCTKPDDVSLSFGLFSKPYKINEQKVEHRIIRIESKINELNSICNSVIVRLSDEPIRLLIAIDIEEEENRETRITAICYDAVEFIDSEYHRCVEARSSFFYLNRYEIGGVLFSSASLYFLFKIVTFLFTNDI